MITLKGVVSQVLLLLVVVWPVLACAATGTETRMVRNGMSPCALTKLRASMASHLKAQPEATHQLIGYSTEGGIVTLHRREGDALSATVELFGESGRAKTRAVKVGRDMMFETTWTDYREPLPSRPVRVASTTVLRGFLCEQGLVVDASKSDGAAVRIDEFKGLVVMFLAEVGKHDPAWVGRR